MLEVENAELSMSQPPRNTQNDTDNGQQIGGVKEAIMGRAQGWGGQAPNLV